MAYQWLLRITEAAQEDIDQLSRDDLFVVFEKLMQLLNADDPIDQQQVTDIKKLRDTQYAGLWRKRAGNWRILYRVDPTPTTYLDFDYRGVLTLVGVVNRRDL